MGSELADGSGPNRDIRTTINIYGHLLPSVDEALADGLYSSTPDNVEPLRRAVEQGGRRGGVAI